MEILRSIEYIYVNLSGIHSSLRLVTLFTPGSQLYSVRFNRLQRLHRRMCPIQKVNIYGLVEDYSVSIANALASIYHFHDRAHLGQFCVFQ